MFVRDQNTIPSLSRRIGRFTLRTGVFLSALLIAASALSQQQNDPYVSEVDPVTSYLDAIELSETEYGAYAPELVDLYLGLGQSLMDNLEYDAAKDAFHQGVQIVRVNKGPQSVDQTNYLYAIADIETRLGDWKAASKVLNNIYYIHAQTYGEESVQMLPVLQSMYKWYLDQRPLYSPAASYQDFERAFHFASKMAYLTEREKGLGHPDTAAIYRSLGQVHFMTVRYVLSKGINVEPGVVMSTGRVEGPNRIEISIREHHRDGGAAFERYAESVRTSEGSTPLEYAEALAQVGDWNLVFKKYQTASDFYIKAYQVLAASDESLELANSYMGQPTPVRFMNNHENFTDPNEFEDLNRMLGAAAIVNPELAVADGSAPAPNLSLDVSMTVTRAGDLRNIEVLNAPNNLTEDQLKAIERQLQVTRFRPGVVNGEIVKMENYVWSYTSEASTAAP